MSRTKNKPSDQPIEDLSNTIKDEVKEQTKEKIVQQASKVLSTDSQVKAERTSAKLDKKEEKAFLKNVSMEGRVNFQNEEKSTPLNPTSTLSNSIKDKGESPPGSKVNISDFNMNATLNVEEDSFIKMDTDKEVKTKILKESSRQEKLEKKINKKDLKLKTRQDKIKDISLEREGKRDKFNELESRTKSRVHSPFSATEVGQRTLPSKIASSPTKVVSKTGAGIKEDFNKDIENSEEGIKLANDVVSKSSIALRKKTVRSFNENVGFDKKSTQLLKLQKEENKLQKKSIKQTKNSYKANHKKYKYGRKQIDRNKGVFATAQDTIKNIVQSIGEPTKLLGNLLTSKKKVVIVGSLVMLMSATAIVLPVSAILMGSNNLFHKKDNVITYAEADIEINLDSPDYQKLNPYTASGYRGQCTWFVWGRVHELYGKSLPPGLGNGGDWIDNIKGNPEFTISDKPKTHSIMVLKNNTGKESDQFGHVAFVESYDPETNLMIVSEANIGNIKRGTPEMVEEARKNYDKYFNLEVNVKGDVPKMHGITIVGYIHIDDFVGGEQQ